MLETTRPSGMTSGVFPFALSGVRRLAVLTLAASALAGCRTMPMADVYYAQAADGWPVACSPDGVCVSIRAEDRAAFVRGICPAI